MEKKPFGKTGMNVAALGFGGGEIGYENAEYATVKELLAAALDQGLNVIDTAECYVDSEEKIGETVSHRRNDFYLFTKCGHGDTYAEEKWSKKDITASIERSLKRLKMDYVDLVQLHSCNEAILRKGEVIEALQEAKKAGKTRFIGYSGDGTDAVYAINTGAFDSLQTSINIADQQCLEQTIPLAVAKGMGVIAKRPIANAAWTFKTKPENTYIHPYWDRFQELKYDFTLNGNANAAVEKALRFTLSVPGVNVAIVGTKRPGRWRENADLLAKGTLSKEEFEAIRKVWHEVSKKDWVGQV
ncbi:hypothetical protein BH10CYA1_BH10CYA1_50280 [soil metagenome]